MDERNFDIAILGAGCAGLSLAMHLAMLAPYLKVVLFDSRHSYGDDRTWCFWTSGNTSVEKLIEKRWSRWGFSTGKQPPIVHTGVEHQYACIRSGRFYRQAIEQIAKTGFQIFLDHPVEAITSSNDGIRIIARGENLLARQVVDTRPSTASKAQLYQVFSGIEIEVNDDAFDPEEVGLMEVMSADEGGFRFVYTLPFSSRHALVELTRFSATTLDPESLDDELTDILAKRGLASAKTIRREHGCLPMGVVGKSSPQDRRIVRAGMVGGALRSATGYAFLRIQHWAEACAQSLAKGGPALAHSPEPAFRSWLDSVFLSALRQKPGKGDAYFMRIASALSPDAFARFMTDAAKPTDLLHLIIALPPLPFIAAAARMALTSRWRG